MPWPSRVSTACLTPLCSSRRAASKASLLLTQLHARREAPRAPAERGRLYLMLAWLRHGSREAALCPVGWTKTYEYNDADWRCALSAIDAGWTLSARGAPTWRRMPSRGRQCAHLASLYGGRVDNAFDHNSTKFGGSALCCREL